MFPTTESDNADTNGFKKECDAIPSTDFEEFVNYVGLDDGEEAATTIFLYEKASYLKSFSTLQEVRDYLRSEQSLSRFGCIRKVRDGRVKERIIRDLMQSKVTEGTRKQWGVILPAWLF